MEENHATVGADDIIQDGSSNSCRTTLNDQLLVESDNFNIATMSDFQFSESLDALIDLPYTENVTTQSPTTTDLPICFDVDETSFTKPPVVSQQQEQQQQQQPVTVHDNSYGSFTGIHSENNSLQQQQSTTSNQFFPNLTATSLMMPIGFDPNTFLTTTATPNNNNNFVAMPSTASSGMPPLTLQQSIEAFGQSLVSHNMNHVYPLPALPPSFANVMYAPPPHQVSTSFSTIPMVGSNMSMGGVSSSSTTATARKRGHNSTFPISEDESDFRKRKSDRNAREQQRAQQVTDQIAHLRELIVRSGVALDKVDKFSTLIAVEQYIRSLQTKSLELKEEHDNLLATLQQTSELVNSQYVSSASPIQVSSGGEESCQAQDSSDQDTDDHSDVDTTAPLMKEINYKWIFDCCPFATGVAAIDGRFLDCNKEFEVMTGYSRAELLPLMQQNDTDDEKTGDVSTHEAPPSALPKKTRNMSIFNVLHRECIEKLFCAMSIVLQRCNNTDSEEDNGSNKTDEEDIEKCGDTITQEVTLCKRSNQKVSQACHNDITSMFCNIIHAYIFYFSNATTGHNTGYSRPITTRFTTIL